MSRGTRQLSTIDVDRINTRNRAAWGRRDRRDGTGPSADDERAAAHPRPAPARQGGEAATRYRLHVSHYRRRLVDVDGLVCKHALDGLVDAGVIPDDSARHIASISHEQHRVATSDEERMVFVFVRTG